MNVLSGDGMQVSNIQLGVTLFGSRPCAGVDPSLQIDNRIQGSSQAVLPSSKHNKSRAANTRDERFRSGNLLLVYAPLVQALFFIFFFFFFSRKAKYYVSCFGILFLFVSQICTQKPSKQLWQSTKRERCQCPPRGAPC